MTDGSADEKTLRPLLSLLGKCEKARSRVAEGSWQRTMLEDNVRALRLALALMRTAPTAGSPAPPAREAEQALAALAAMIGKARAAQAGFQPGTAHHTLQANRLRALEAAAACIRHAARPRT